MSETEIIISSDNGLSPIRRQAIIRTNAGLLSISSLQTNFNEIWFEIKEFSFQENEFECCLQNGSNLAGL